MADWRCRRYLRLRPCPPPRYCLMRPRQAVPRATLETRGKIQSVTTRTCVACFAGPPDTITVILTQIYMPAVVGTALIVKFIRTVAVWTHRVAPESGH